LDHLPLLKVPQQVFFFDMCGFCHSVFRNPKDDDQANYRKDMSKVAAFKAQGTAPFTGIVSTCEQRFPKATKTVVDAACGAGQALALLRQRHPELKLFGLELSGPSVEHMRSLGIDAAVADLDHDELDPILPPASVDFIIFYEAFEHVRQPLTVLKKLVRLLRQGGRLHFTAQYYGPESSLPVRVGEPIYLDRHGLDWVVSQLDVGVHDLVVDTKFRVTLERT
jgi:SAM-dependent methyltransferase